MDRMPKYIPARDRVVRLDRRRGHALLEYVIQLANGGDGKAASFLDAVAAGAFDKPPSRSAVASFVQPYARPGDSGLRLFAKPSTVKPENPTNE
jgi:hypothetical protein